MMIGALPLLLIQPGEMSATELQKVPRDDAFVFVAQPAFLDPRTTLSIALPLSGHAYR